MLEINKNRPFLLKDKIPEQKYPLKTESILRIMRLDAFTGVFKAVSKDYKKVSPGEIIDVYERLTGI